MKERDSNLELLRIISMCGIIVMHYFNKDLGGVIQNCVFPNFSWIFSHILNSVCIPLVNCFVLITGYFLVEKTIFSFRKPLYLLLITVFYGVIAYAIAITAGGEISLDGIVMAICPYFYGKRWFVETYIILILLAPFLSKLLKTLSKQQFELLLTIQIVIFSIWYSLGLSAPILDDGYGIINFISLYMIGGYIRLYDNKSEYLLWKKTRYVSIFITCALLTFGLSYFINSYGYAFITNIIGSTAIFIFFLKLDFGKNKFINRISETAFDAYFIHSDTNTSNLLINEVLKGKCFVDSPWMILHLLLVIPIIWLIGIFVNMFRKYIFHASVDRWLNRCTHVNRQIQI